ncbi:unnamed protein product [Gongylonema pulchrum]|uniref:Nucleolin-like n=1 Tax=Gongylonema pulchrum TaxID=637853 RepID=A0A183DC00_9BILA|nr:unnamed protein product [Gongylonema pulchrum]
MVFFFFLQESKGDSSEEESKYSWVVEGEEDVSSTSDDDEQSAGEDIPEKEEGDSAGHPTAEVLPAVDQEAQAADTEGPERKRARVIIKFP